MSNLVNLKPYFSVEEGIPLGPISAFAEVSDEYRRVFDAYYDRDNYPFRKLSKNPVMIVGRRGSGKTDILLNYAFKETQVGNKYRATAYFEARKAANMFYTLVSKVSEQARENEPRPMVEAIAQLWTQVFWVCLFNEIITTHPDNDDTEIVLLKKFLEDFGIEAAKYGPYTLSLKYIVRLKSAHNVSGEFGTLNFFSVLDQLVKEVSQISIEDCTVAALNFLQRYNEQAIILIDSFEELNILNDEIHLALSGFLKAVGGFSRPGYPVDIRCCIPAEVYFKVLEISSNVLKDFNRTNILHWSAGELLKLSAKRCAKYIELWEPEKYNELVKPNNLSTRTGVNSFWRNILPEFVPNTKKNTEERTIPYILRHTQLLPRQIITYLNQILSTHIRETGSIKNVKSSIITEQIRETEHKIVDQIVGSYSTIWPEADNQLTLVLKNLSSNIITYGEIHQKFNRAGVSGQGNVHDYHDFLKMLSELGVVGRMIERKSEYAKAVFEYSEPNRLTLGEKDVICIHPVFTEHYGVIASHSEKVPETYKPVTPLGSDPDEEDRRQLNDLL